MIDRISTRLSTGLLFAALPSLFLLTTGCGGGKAEAKTSAKAEANVEEDAEFDVEGDAAWDVAEDDPGTPVDATAEPARSEKSQRTSNQSASTTGGAAMLGARHDLALAEAGAPACKCLAVSVGAPTSPAFSWASKAPKTSPSQLVIALGSEGVSCSEQAPVASYGGYAKEGNNVIITVEASESGRPVTRGAIIPKPASGGKVIIRSAGEVPYGKAVSGGDVCAVYP